MAAAGSTGAPRAPAIVERFIKQLNIAYKAVGLYPESSGIPRETAGAAVAILKTLLEREPSVLFVVMRDGLLYEGAAVFPDSAAFASFARDLYARNLSEVRFHAGCGDLDVVRFLTVLGTPPETVLAAGGFAAELWELDVTTITVTDTTARIVDEGAGGQESAGETESDEAWPPVPERVEQIITEALAGRTAERRLLVRVVGDGDVLAGHLRSPKGAGGRPPTIAAIAARLTALARGVWFEVGEEREALLRELAEAVLGLDPETRQALIGERLLSEARHDDMIAAILRQMSVEELMDSVLYETSETDEARAGVSRALRYLTLIDLASSRDVMLQKAADSMRTRGLTEPFVESVIAGAVPDRLAVHESTRSSSAESVESVLKLIDLTPERGDAHVYDESVAPLREEAARGLTDGDVVAALVSIVTLEARPEHSERLAVLVGDRIAYLLDQQEFEVAADAAVALRAAEQNEGLPLGHRNRMRELLRLLSKPESMRKVTTAMRVFRHDSPEHAACRRLLGVLGSYAVSSLLEVLAEEQDMAARKALVDLLRGIAERSIPDLGARVEDRRWYFVRNVVAVLGSTRNPDVLQYFGRTLRHPDERVRRETIRAVSGIRDALATEMLVAALADDNAQNVQLAARYLGAIGGRGVVPALEQVARGEGRGNRENGPRIEAMEALGRVGTVSSEAVLADIMRQRGLVAGRTREIRAGAESALAALRARADGRPGG